MVLSEATSLRYNLGWYRARSSFADRPWPRTLRPALPMIQPCPASSFNEPAWGCGLTQNYSSRSGQALTRLPLIRTLDPAPISRTLRLDAV